MGKGFEMGNDGPSAILVGVDGSPTSLHAAAYAAGLARRQRARLIVVYVRQAVPAMVALSPSSGAQGLVAAYEIQDGIEAELRAAILEEVPCGSVDARLVVRVGDPYTQLAAVAREVRADALVVGASTRAGHRIAGSLAVRLVRAGHWPVTVVP